MSSRFSVGETVLYKGKEYKIYSFHPTTNSVSLNIGVMEPLLVPISNIEKKPVVLSDADRARLALIERFPLYTAVKPKPGKGGIYKGKDNITVVGYSADGTMLKIRDMSSSAFKTIDISPNDIEKMYGGGSRKRNSSKNYRRKSKRRFTQRRRV